MEREFTGDTETIYLVDISGKYAILIHCHFHFKMIFFGLEG